MWQEFDATRPASAKVMLWPYQPDDAVAKKLEERSIKVVVVDSLVAPPNSGDYFSIMNDHIDLLSNELQGQ